MMVRKKIKAASIFWRVMKVKLNADCSAAEKYRR